MWATQKRCTVALSSVEYMGIIECAMHTRWSISLLQQLDFNIDLPIDIHHDSLGARVITKHIDIHYHYIRDAIDDGIIDDILTKSLS